MASASRGTEHRRHLTGSFHIIRMATMYYVLERSIRRSEDGSTVTRPALACSIFRNEMVTPAPEYATLDGLILDWRSSCKT
ncbi:hypothetical protein BN2475_670019 [Paraburkholderia ribeironis]|uniref:Uncharacterized protein n=1 Tax=Paraburkholderia ribeironis TaxID=1247936 RepID=A0A1N7SH04_9BURK|nr:hypothetical protein BN2475_670019 [Paraburkholderia ribeironis]